MSAALTASNADVSLRHAASAIPAGSTAPRRRRLLLTAAARREIILALLLLFCYGFFRQVPAWNEYSRYDLVLALVDDRTTRIDRYHQNTGDKAFRDGHYYSDKAPGSSFLVVPVYAALRGAAMLMGSDLPDPARTMHALTFAASGLPTVLLALLLLRFLRPLVGERWGLAITGGYAFGTLAFPFATMYFGHAASTFFLFAAFYVLWRSGPDGRAGPFLWAGFLAGWAVLVEVSAAAVVAGLLLYALARDRRAPFLMVLGALPPAVLLLGYNWVSFGGPLSFGYTNLVSGGFATGMSRGILGVTRPKAAVLSEILLGPRGLLHLSPWLALAPLGLLATRRPGLRREVVLCGAISLAFLLFNAGYYLPLGGWTPGPRFLMPALPFATVLVALAPRAFRPLIALQIGYSIIICAIATSTMPNAPEAVRDPLGDLWLRRFLARDLAETTAWLRWGLHGAQPLLILALAAAVAVAALLATTRPGAAARRLAGVATGVLTALVLTFATPLDLPGGLGLVGGGAASAAPGTAGGNAAIAIVDAGVTFVPVEKGRPKVRPWAQLENGAGRMEKTTVVFSIHEPSGKQVWSAWHGDVGWRGGERKRLGVEWSPGGVAPGDYRVSVTVMSADRQVTFARVEDAGRIRFGP